MQEEGIGEPGTARGAQPAAELARALSEALSAADHARVRSLVEGLEAPDLADLIELLEPAQRVQLVEALGPVFRPEVLSELDETVRDQLLPALPKDVLAKAVAELETDDAAYLLENLEPSRSGRKSWRRCRPGERAALERNLEYPRRDRRPSHADGLRGGAAVLDGRPGHRPHARGRGSAGDLLRHLRRRSRPITCSAAWI